MDVINCNEVEDIISKLIKMWIENAREIRFFFQAVSSPAYDKERNEQFANGTVLTDVVCAKFADRLALPIDLLQSRIQLMLMVGQFLSLWGDNENGFVLCKEIYQDILKKVKE